MDDRTVKIVMNNRRDYWLCTDEGHLQFHDPRAAAGEAQFEFRHGKRYCHPQFALHDREQGLSLIRSAAAKGYKHAIRFLERKADSDESIQPVGFS